MVRAIEVAREAGRKVAFTLSDTFCVDRHRDGFNQLLDEGRIDILFANQAEIEALAGVAASRERGRRDRAEGRDAGCHAQRRWGAGDPCRRTRRRARRADRQLVDTTGAGDLFAAGFLLGTARGEGLEQSLRLGAIAAAEVIQHYGARPERTSGRLPASFSLRDARRPPVQVWIVNDVHDASPDVTAAAAVKE